MAVEIFLGEPPANIKQWIIEHATPPGPTGHAETIFTFTNNRTVSLNISGPLGYLWVWDDDAGADIFVYEGSDKLLKSDLVSVDIGNIVTGIGDQVFSGCSGLTSVMIPSSVKEIGWQTFYDCSGLASVMMPNVTSIGSGAFSLCTSLRSVMIGSDIESISDTAFEDCGSLTSVTFQGKSLTEVQEMDNYPWEISDTSIINVA